MAGVMDYHCPNCGGALQFDAELQKLKCPYCESLFSTADFIEKDENLNQQPAESGPQAGGGAAGQSAVGADGQSGAGAGVGAGDQSGAGGVGYGGQAGHAAAPNQTQAQHGTQDVGGHTLTFDGETAWGDGEDEHLRVYSCPNCRAQVIADETTAATHCPYCGNVVVMEGQLSGDLKPDYVIPFKVTKEKAVAAFKRYINRSKFVPKVFSAQEHPEDIKGVYVPFWLFNADADVNATFHAENIRIWTDRKYEYTETSFYELVRGGTIAMRHVPVDGSKKMADELMESIEPFDFSEAVPFQTAYLAGFMADRYDVGYAECTDRANHRMETSAMETLKNTAKGYDVVRLTSGNCNWKHANIKYALYPVWLLSTTWEGTNYLFAMNGQSGKFIGDLPLDKKAFRRYRLRTCLICTAVFFVIFLILAMFLL